MERPACGIVQDLLLSYHDGLTGESVTGMIQEHLAECPKCRQRYEELKRQQEAEESTELSRGKRFGEKLKSIRYYVIGILIGLALPIVLIIVWYAVSALCTYFEFMLYSYFW